MNNNKIKFPVSGSKSIRMDGNKNKIKDNFYFLSLINFMVHNGNVIFINSLG